MNLRYLSENAFLEYDILIKIHTIKTISLLVDIDSGLMATRQKEGREEIERSPGGQIFGDRRKCNFEW